MKPILAVTTVLLMTMPRNGSAQANPDSVIIRNRCRLAQQIVSTGHPAPHERWALSFIGNCGAQGGVALAAGIRALRASSDTVALAGVSDRAFNLRDASIFAAALDVAGDASASVVARVFAFRTLLWALHPTRPATLEDMIPPASDPGLPPACGAGRYSTHSPSSVGATLPEDYRQRIASLVDAVRSDPGLDRKVRAAAWCVR